MGPVNTLVAGWAAWLAVGLVLAVWHYQATRNGFTRIEQPAPARPLPKPRSDVRPAVKTLAPPDAFAELEALLDGKEN